MPDVPDLPVSRDHDDLIEASDVARILGVSVATVRLMDAPLTAARAMLGRTPRGSRIYSRTAIERFAAERDAAKGSAAASAIARAIELESLYCSATEAGDLLGVPSEELRLLRQTGKIRAVKVESTYRLRRSDVERLAAERGR